MEKNIGYLRRGVVHVVLDRVQSRVTRARVTASRAARAWAGLGRGIINQIAGAIAVVAIKGVGKAKPVASLVSTNEADSILGQRAAIADEGIRALRRDSREVAVTSSRRENVDNVEVHGLVAALAEGGLHGHLLAVALVGPVGINGLGAAGIVDSDAVGAEGVTQGVELELEIGVAAEGALAG